MFKKSLTSISSALTGNSEKNEVSSYSYNNYIRRLCNLNSKKNEREFVNHETQLCKRISSKTETSNVLKKECLFKLLFFHLLGHDVSFAFIHAIKLAQSNLSDKNTGYLLSSLFLGDKHDLSVLLVNTITKDLKSPQDYVALTYSCHLINVDYIPSLLEEVTKKITNQSFNVRVRAVMCLKSFVQKVHQNDSSTTLYLPAIIKCLQDKEPTVVLVTIEIIRDIYEYHKTSIKRESDDYLNHTRIIIIKACVDILAQISNKETTPSECLYHGIPNPWFQISILKTFVSLASASQECTELVLEPLLNVLQLDTSVRSGLMVVFEAVKTVCSLDFISHDDIFKFVKHVNVFLDSKSPNVKLAGLKLLRTLSQKDQSFIMPFQSSILTCLKSHDNQLLNATLALMSDISNPTNKEIVYQKLSSQLETIIKKNHEISPYVTLDFSEDLKSNGESDYNEDVDGIDDDEDEDDEALLVKSITDHLLNIIFRFILEDPLWSIEKYWRLISTKEVCSLDCITKKLFNLIDQELHEELRDQCISRSIQLAVSFLKECHNEACISKESCSASSFKSIEEDTEVQNGKEIKITLNIHKLLFSLEVLGAYHSFLPPSSADFLAKYLISILKMSNDNQIKRYALYALIKIFSSLTNKKIVFDDLEMLKKKHEENDIIMKIVLWESHFIVSNEKLIVDIEKACELPDFSLSCLDEKVCESLENNGCIYVASPGHKPPPLFVNMHGKRHEDKGSAMVFEEASNRLNPDLSLFEDNIDPNNINDFNDEDENMTGWTIDGYKE